MDLSDLVNEFRERFEVNGREVRIFRAPGRVNLIGEHTDYNDGFVLPAALKLATYVAAAPRDDRRIRAASAEFPGTFEIELDDTAGNDGSWARYVKGVAVILEREGISIAGADMLIATDLPIGAGVSSSAALELSTALALSTLSGHAVDRMHLARICQKAEHEFGGVKSGIMDQFTSAFGVEGAALYLDCRSMEWKEVPLGNASFLLCNTRVKHDLAEGEYNRRRLECESAAAWFGKASLRDVPYAEFEVRAGAMPEIERKRARHILTENRRVAASVEALENGELAKLGKLMDLSHISLRDDFEVSCRELDIMAEAALGECGVLGARMTGGGFGGSVLVLVEETDPCRASQIAAKYREATGIEPDIMAVEFGPGASEVSAE